MARLARRLFGTDWGLAVTGYADDMAPVEGPRAHGVPDRNPEGAVRVAAEKREPMPGLTFIAVSGPGGGSQPESHSWEEWQLEAPDRATYKQHAAQTAIETLLKIVKG